MVKPANPMTKLSSDSEALIYEFARDRTVLELFIGIQTCVSNYRLLGFDNRNQLLWYLFLWRPNMDLECRFPLYGSTLGDGSTLSDSDLQKAAKAIKWLRWLA